ncbi:hypothetical protein Drorol1_Dr00018133 [Drosera rotundifolia]
MLEPWPRCNGNGSGSVARRSAPPRPILLSAASLAWLLLFSVLASTSHIAQMRSHHLKQPIKVNLKIQAGIHGIITDNHNCKVEKELSMHRPTTLSDNCVSLHDTVKTVPFTHPPWSNQTSTL